MRRLLVALIILAIAPMAHGATLQTIAPRVNVDDLTHYMDTHVTDGLVFYSSNGIKFDFTGTLNAGDTLYVDEANSRVGIKLASPTDTLDVFGSVVIGDGLTDANIKNAAGTALIYIPGAQVNLPNATASNQGLTFGVGTGELYNPSTGIVWNDSGATPEIWGDDVVVKLGDQGGTYKWILKDSGGSTVVDIDSDGQAYFASNVGVKEGTPGAALDVNGSVRLGDGSSNNSIENSAGTAMITFNGGLLQLPNATGAATALEIGGGASLHESGTGLLVDNSLGTPNITGLDVQIKLGDQAGSNEMQVLDGGDNKVAAIDSDGGLDITALGISGSAGSDLLDIAGDGDEHFRIRQDAEGDWRVYVYDTGTSSYVPLAFQDDTLTVDSDGEVIVQLGDASGAKEFRITDNAGTPQTEATIDSDGNAYFRGDVGIGIASPGQELDVLGSIRLGVGGGDDNIENAAANAMFTFSGDQIQTPNATAKASSLQIGGGADLYESSTGLMVDDSSSTPTLYGSWINLKLNNADGTNEIRVLDSADATVASTDSDGNAQFDGNVDIDNGVDLTAAVTQAKGIEIGGATGAYIYDDTNGLLIESKGGDPAVKLSDAAGARSFVVMNSTPAYVATINSNGGAYFAGNMGIQDNTPQYDLDIGVSSGGELGLSRIDAFIGNGETLGTIYFAGTDDDEGVGAKIVGESNAIWGAPDNTSGELIFYTCNVGSGTEQERMRIFDHGDIYVAKDVGINHTTPAMQLEIADSAGADMSLMREDATITDAELLGAIYFRGTDEDESSGAMIDSYAAGAWGTDDHPSDLGFSTTPDGTNTLTLQMYIDQDGGIFMYNLKSGANQAAAGAAANELYHDTDDNTIKIGV